MSTKTTTENLEYTEAENFVRNKLESLPHGKLMELTKINPNIKYPTLIAFLHRKLKFNAKKLIADCLVAFGYENVQVETTTRFVFQKKEKASLNSKI